MFIQIVAYCLLIAFQLESVVCTPQSQNFNGSNPYYDNYLNQYYGDNSFGYNNPNPYSTTPKPLYPTLYPTTSPPYSVKGQYNPTPQPNYFNRNSSFQYPSAGGQYNPTTQSNYFNRNSSFQNPNNNFAGGQYNPTPQSNYFNRNSSFQNANDNFSGGQYNPSTQSNYNRNSSFQNPSGYNSSYGWNSNFNPYTTPSTYKPYGQTRTNTVRPPVTTMPPFYPTGTFNQYNRTSSAYPVNNRTNPTYPSYRPQPTFPNTSPQPTFTNNRVQPTYPTYNPQGTFNYNQGQRNLTNNYNNTFPSWNRNNTSPPPFASQNTGQGIKNGNSHNNYNFDRTNNNYNPQYRPSAPTFTNQVTYTTKPHYDQNGVPLATFESFHAKAPIDDNLFNYDNLHRRRPNNGIESSAYAYDQSNVPLAPFPGSRTPTYDSISNVPLAPFPGSG